MIFLLACAEPEAVAPVLTPASGPMSGYYDVRIEGVSEVERVVLGGVMAYDHRPDGTGVVVTVQGAPSPGPADLVLTSGGVETTWPEAFTYDENVDPVFDRMVGIGASFTQGVQSGVPTDHGALASPGTLLARQAGAFYSLPLLIPGLFPQIEPADVGPPPECVIPDVTGFVSDSAVEVIDRLEDPETGAFAFFPGRVDPDLVPRNLAVGGSTVHQVLYASEEFGENFLAHLVYDPYATLTDELPGSQTDLAVAVEPTLIVSFDLLGNDLIDSVIHGDDVSASYATPVDTLRADLDALMPVLAGTGAEVFVANVPDPSVLGAAQQKLARMEPAAAEAAVADVAALAGAYNDALDASIAAYPNVHVVDLATLVADIAENGWNGVEIEVVGGFVSLDGLHFSDTGYAVLAEAFREAVNRDLGLDLPPIDTDEIVANDVYSVASLAAQGLDVTACR